MESDFIEQETITMELRMLVGNPVEINLRPNVSFAIHAEEIFDLVTGNTLLKLANCVKTKKVSLQKKSNSSQLQQPFVWKKHYPEWSSSSDS